MKRLRGRLVISMTVAGEKHSSPLQTVFSAAVA
ncbi:hypothetical protein LIHA111178_03965 [Litorimonas haliclonae]